MGEKKVKKKRARKPRLVNAVYFSDSDSPICPTCLNELNPDNKPKNDTYGVDEDKKHGKHMYFKRVCECKDTVKFLVDFQFKRIKTKIIEREA
jgi:hypothetical protein